jgi:hypothetical protein
MSVDEWQKENFRDMQFLRLVLIQMTSPNGLEFITFHYLEMD